MFDAVQFKDMPYDTMHLGARTAVMFNANITFATKNYNTRCYN